MLTVRSLLRDRECEGKQVSLIDQHRLLPHTSKYVMTSASRSVQRNAHILSNGYCWFRIPVPFQDRTELLAQDIQ